jgi:NodT family efflux transporter outer membrane factor (OMF) lipoprotein
MYHYRTIAGFPILICFLMLIVTGCMVGPNFHSPKTSAPSAWLGPTAQMNFDAARQTELVHWWTTFNDTTLTSLVDRAVKANLDLQQAQARILQARANRGIIAADLWPTINVSAGVTRSRSVASSSLGTVATMRNLFQTGLDAAWELDVFGRVRRNIEAADADVQISIEDYRGTLVTLAAEVALNYIELRGFQQEIIIAQNNLQSQQHTAGLTRKRFQVGLVSALDVANAEAQVASTSSQIPLIETAAQQAIYNLSVLLALEPAALVKELSPASPIPANPPEIPMVLPSALLLRRPDVRSAEAQIHSATARIGAATADLFPRFNLIGATGFQGSKSNDWIKGINRVWSVSPSVDLNIFDTGRIRSNIELQKAIQNETLLSYQKTILTAFQEVENALIAYAKEQQRRTALIDAVTANRKAVRLSTLLYTEGQTDFLNVLDAQRSQYTSEQALVISTRSLSTDLVALYKALGGGWEAYERPSDLN